MRFGWFSFPLPRRGPRLGARPAPPTDFFDREGHTLESVFPVPGVEPFQELTREHFERQQEASHDDDDEPHGEEDFLFGTHGGAHPEEEGDPHRWTRERYRRAGRVTPHREGYYPLEGPVEALGVRSPPAGPARGVDPGDGPQALDFDEPQEYSPFDYPDRPEDWYAQASRLPGLVQEAFPPGGPLRHFLFRHRAAWSFDPQGDPHRWAARAAGLVPWLHRGRARQWGPLGRDHHLDRRAAVVKYIIPRARRRGPRGPRRRPRSRRAGWTHRPRGADPRARRWNHPDLAWQHDLDEGDASVFFPDLRWGLAHRARRLRLRVGRLGRIGPGVGFLRRRHPRHLARGSRGPRRGWSTRRGHLLPRGSARSRGAPWGAPRYAPLHEAHRGLPRPGVPRGVVPPGGVALLVGGVLLAVGAEHLLAGLEWLAVRLAGGNDLWGRSRLVPLGWGDMFFLSNWDPSPAGDFLRRAREGSPEWWEPLRDGTPRGPRTVREWYGWAGMNRSEQAWRDNPGVDTHLFSHRLPTHWAAWWDERISPDYELLHRVLNYFSQDPSGPMEFLFTWNHQLPSWAHLDEQFALGRDCIHVSKNWPIRWLFRVHKAHHYRMTSYDAPSGRRSLDFEYNRVESLGGWFYRTFQWKGYRGYRRLYYTEGDLFPRKVLEYYHTLWDPPEARSLDGLAYLEGFETASLHVAWPDWEVNYADRSPLLVGRTDELATWGPTPDLLQRGHHLTGVPPRWETRAGAARVAAWAAHPDHHRPRAWLGDLVVGSTRWVDPLWGFFLGFTRVTALVGGAVLLGGVSRPPAGVRVVPTRRYAPRGVSSPGRATRTPAGTPRPPPRVGLGCGRGCPRGGVCRATFPSAPRRWRTFAAIKSR